MVLASCGLLSGARRQISGREDGYDLWLRYARVADTARLAEYRAAITELVVTSGDPTMQVARDELALGLNGVLGRPVPVADAPTRDGTLVVGTPANSPAIASLPLA